LAKKGWINWKSFSPGGVRSREKMVYGNEVLHKTLSGALGASRLKLLGRIRRKPARLPPIWEFRPFPMILGSF